MPHLPGFDIGQKSLEPAEPVFQMGDTVRCRTSRILFVVVDVDGEDIYCRYLHSGSRLMDPFSAAGLEFIY